MPQVKITKSTLQRIIQEELGHMMGEEGGGDAGMGGAEKEMAELERMMGQHDWTYEYSDDYRYWSRGSDEARAIHAKIKEIAKKDPALGEKALQTYQSRAQRAMGR